jgi:hypothetical protein
MFINKKSPFCCPRIAIVEVAKFEEQLTKTERRVEREQKKLE